MRYLIFLCIFNTHSILFADIEILAEKVIKLRKEVELLNDEYKLEREKAMTDLKAMSLQKAELESSIRNEKIREQQFVEKISKYKKELKGKSLESKELLPILDRTILTLKTYINESLPFNQRERLALVHDLEKKLKKNEVSPIKASNQLWAMIEDERRLAKETSIHKQTISIEGEMSLAHVIKIGMFFIYFKSDDGRVGMAQRNGGEWVFKTFQLEADKVRTLAFFQSIKKQIRQGFFELPTNI